MAYEMVMPYHLHMPSYFLETFTEYPCVNQFISIIISRLDCFYIHYKINLPELWVLFLIHLLYSPLSALSSIQISAGKRKILELFKFKNLQL